MNILVEICKSYNGNYYENGILTDVTKSEESNAKSKIVLFTSDDYKYEVNLNVFDGPFVIKLFTPNWTLKYFKIYRIGFWGKRFSKATLYNSFTFKGDELLYKELKLNTKLAELMNQEHILIEGTEKEPNTISIKPFTGIYSLDQFKKYKFIIDEIANIQRRKWNG